MKIDVKFYGPCSDDLADDGMVDFELGDNDVLSVGKGISRGFAANNALLDFTLTSKSEYLQDVADYVAAQLTSRDAEVEADGVTHYIFCVIRFTE